MPFFQEGFKLKWSLVLMRNLPLVLLLQYILGYYLLRLALYFLRFLRRVGYSFYHEHLKHHMRQRNVFRLLSSRFL